VAREVRSDTNNYYTYNYYSTDSTVGSSDPQQTIYGNPGRPIDAASRSDQSFGFSPGTQPATVADVWFENGVKAFEAEQYAAAAEEFRQAIESDSGDRIVPFAYSQPCSQQVAMQRRQRPCVRHWPGRPIDPRVCSIPGSV